MRVVVGAAIFAGTPDGPRVLLGRRSRPPELAGRWEFPGGKVEPGETEDAALARECTEELGVSIEVLGRLGGDVPLPGGAVLRVARARLRAGHPQLREHRALAWVGPEELAGLDWIPANRLLLADLRAELDRRAGGAGAPST